VSRPKCQKDLLIILPVGAARGTPLVSRLPLAAVVVRLRQACDRNSDLDAPR
jgi:hypothetical protein